MYTGGYFCQNYQSDYLRSYFTGQPPDQYDMECAMKEHYKQCKHNTQPPEIHDQMEKIGETDCAQILTTFQ